MYFAGQYLDFTHPILVPIGIALGVGVYAAVFWGLRPSMEDREFVAYLRGKQKPALQVDQDFDQV